MNVFLFLAGFFLDESVKGGNVCENMLRPFLVHLYFETKSLFLFFHQFLQVGSLDVHAQLNLLVKELMAFILWGEFQLFEVREK